MGARASRPHAVSLGAAEFPCDAAGSRPFVGNPIGQAAGEPWCRCRWMQVGERAKAAPGLVRARRPRSQGASFHDLVAARAKKYRRLLAPYVIEGGPPLFRSIGVHSCLLVVRLHFKVRSPGSRRRDTPHRISHRLAARLLRLPLKGGVMLGTNREHGLHLAKVWGKAARPAALAIPTFVSCTPRPGEV